MHGQSSLRPAALVRVLTVTALTAALALVPGAAQAHGGPGGHPPRQVNHAPDAPSDVGTSSPDSSCSATVASPLRSTTPTLRATLSDVDGDSLRGVFEVRDGRSGRPLWSSRPTAAQASGAVHAVQVPDGLLRDGGVYEWRVQARDTKNRKGPVVRCRVVVDVAAPAVPVVTPLAGAGAVYLEDALAGGVGVAGDFRLDAPGATDVVAFLYAFDGAPARVDLAPGTTGATVRWTPSTAGTHVLTAQAVDSAGNVSPERAYRFIVASASSAPSGNARWTLDEGAGTTSADVLSTDGSNSLTLTPSTTWTDGLRAELWGSADSALLLDEPTDGASTTGPVLDTTGSWSVVAFVRAGTSDVEATAVSQDGDSGSVFRLGLATTGCTDEAVSCWSLAVAGSTGETSTATSTVPVVPGAWVALFGIRDAASGTVRLDVCDLGTAQAPGSPSPQAGEPVSLEAGAAGTGAFRVGGTQDGSSPWVGAVSGARTWGGVIDVMQERRLCSAGA
ncbi:LamG-like jellyroll fold domain-containing protein [Cellulomonas xiejunii]|uniref:LamG-like jellyroll fold domain-containing protein n=1 Tax=Cellulomonas xiejunii TaxID=2968083 RepID=A0ABY5KTP4_9CELL|nr:LamG-like jellyroll fold domain-containing protein [Cellulomonas xiejunii]MCC2321115.1 hypothetical protein [Cellulomonas xiejunii]UUI71708.1 hypothetical protein NP048_18270 [Cellulomonas xiejunii]